MCIRHLLKPHSLPKQICPVLELLPALRTYKHYLYNAITAIIYVMFPLSKARLYQAQTLLT